MPSGTLPATLPARIYLLACDVEKHRQRTANIAVIVRGALLAELSLRGCLVEEGHRVRASGSKRTGDPVLDGVLGAMSEDRPRSWRSWLRRDTRLTLSAVRRQLAADGLIGVDRDRVLGVFPTTRITVHDPARVAELRASVRDLVTGTVPVARVSTEDAALIALVAVGQLNAVLSGRERRAHADRIAEFTERGGSAVSGLKRVLRQIKSARAAAAGGG
jgi:hypothetical protein